MRATLMFLWRLAVAIGCTSALALAAGPAQNAPIRSRSAIIPISPEQQVALGVRLAAVQPAAAAHLALPARVVVPIAHQAVVSAPVSGLVVTILVNAGDRVKRGQILAELSSPQIAQLQRERADAATQQGLARAQVQRDAQLVQEGIIPAARLQQAQARQREADAMMDERALALRLAAGDAGLDGKARVRAPMDGVIVQSLALPGQRLDMSAPLFHIATPGQLGLEIEATPDQAASVEPGAAVGVPEAGAEGVLQTKAPVLSAGQTVLLRVRLTKPGSLPAGALVQASVSLPAQRGLWRVPPASVTQMAGHDAVLVAVQGGFRIVPVRVASRLNDAVIVAGPLRTGDQVAASSVVAIKAAAAEAAP
ncbi:MAG: efflux RND transporter periplasmic adaptor subunit [Betaproteobacteria bacterium]|nr:efflux RND transporter periplasmic adaptor subunit [Betaproteobacteria bacterium]